MTVDISWDQAIALRMRRHYLIERVSSNQWAMRATLHVLPAADLGAFIAGLSIWKPGGWLLKDPAAIPVAGYIDRSLRGKILNRTELAEAITKLGAKPKLVEGMLGSWSSSLRSASFIAGRGETSAGCVG